jgi:SEC-C motif
VAVVSAAALRARAQAVTLAAAARVQLGTLRAQAADMEKVLGEDLGVEAQSELVVAAVGLAREHGLAVVGAGSTRVAVEAGSGAVAKYAHALNGLALNLSEAAFWLAFPERIRRHLAPCLVLSPELVLVQERVEHLAPTLLDEDLEAHLEKRRELRKAGNRAVRKRLAGINRQRAGVGFTMPIIGGKVRLDNYGLRGDRVVEVDYAEHWQPVEAAWAWLLRRLDGGETVRLDDDERAAFYGELEEHGAVSYARQSPLTFAARAGLRYAAEDPCPCGSGETYGECAPERCWTARDVVAEMAPAAHINWEPQLPRIAFGGPRPPRTTDEAIAEGLAAAAGIPSRVAYWKFSNATRGALSEDGKSLGPLTELSTARVSGPADASLPNALPRQGSEARRGAQPA